MGLTSSKGDVTERDMCRLGSGLSLSVIIPALNESARISAALDSVYKAAALPLEVIVVDGGSSDDTVHQARRHGAQVIQTDAGRGRQLNAGWRAARGDWCLFLHSDSELPPQYDVRISEALQRSAAVASSQHQSRGHTRSWSWAARSSLTSRPQAPCNRAHNKARPAPALQFESRPQEDVTCAGASPGCCCSCCSCSPYNGGVGARSPQGGSGLVDSCCDSGGPPTSSPGSGSNPTHSCSHNFAATTIASKRCHSSRNRKSSCGGDGDGGDDSSCGGGQPSGPHHGGVSPKPYTAHHHGGCRAWAAWPRQGAAAASAHLMTLEAPSSTPGGCCSGGHQDGACRCNLRSRCVGALELTRAGPIVAASEPYPARGYTWGAFSTIETDLRNPLLRWALSSGVELRTRLLHRPYGDQALFVRRDVLQAAGGFVEWPLLEDLELVTRLSKESSPVIVDAPVRTAGRRWQSVGFLRTLVINQAILAAYAVGVPPDTLAEWYRAAKK